MKKVKIKICGMKEKHNINSLVQLPIDYLGFIFYPPSQRYIGDLDIATLAIPDSIQKVGVFVNEETHKVDKMAKRQQLDILQLHGDETPDTCAKLKEKDHKIIKAFGVDGDFEWGYLHGFLDFVDYFLFDTKSSQYGGTGHTFDWQTLSSYPFDKPFFLSGGIGADNCEEACNLKDKNLFGVDLNSKLEITPGIKDINLIENMFKTILK